MMTNIQRRSILRVLGLAGSTAVLPSLMPRTARAATAPKRLLWFFTVHGTLPTFWVPKAGNETDFVLNDLLAPLEPHKKDLLLFDSLNMKDRELPDNKHLGNAHQQGVNSSVAGIDAVDANRAGGPSLDQLVAKANNGKTKFASLEMGFDGRGNNRLDPNFPSYGFISHAGPGQKLPAEGDLRRLWSRVFSGFTPPTGGQPTAPAPVDNTNKRQKSILDYIGAEISAVNPRLSIDDRRKLDAHASGIRDLEVRLNLGAASTAAPLGNAPGMGCTALAQPAAGGTVSANYDAYAKFIAMVYACDLTRVVSLPAYVPEDSVGGYSNGAFGTSDLHDLAHKTPPNGQLRTNPGAMEMAKAYHLQSTVFFRKLLDALAATPDVDGKRLLDNTVALWTNELADGGHATEDCKWLLAGNAGGAIRTGRWLKCNKAPHQNMYVSVGQALGLAINSFGDARSCTGKLGGF